MVFNDWKWNSFPVDELEAQVTFFTMDEQDCCIVKNENAGESCNEIAKPEVV